MQMAFDTFMLCGLVRADNPHAARIAENQPS